MQLPYSNLQIKHQNPEASKPLILPVHNICNTDDETLYANIKANSHAKDDWQRLVPAHDGVAILCGSGPSLAESLPEIAEKQAMGGKVFAMNGAAKFLHENMIEPDYQVILDARAETAQLIGPAKEHLFASQCHPSLFQKVPDAKLWHLQITDIEDYFPQDYSRSYVLIGGSASVGNTATCLAYAMGYRNLQIYGYDSSHRGDNGHAFSQPMNAGDPLAHVTFNGKDYVASLTMKMQAEKFPETTRALVAGGCHVEVHGDGLLPAMWNAPIEHLTEQEKYERMWSYSAYRNHAPGEDAADEFLEVVKPSGKVIDFGCGTGRGALKISQAGLDVVLIDFVMTSRDHHVKHLSFLQWDLTEPMILKGDYGYCTDVMEHIPPHDVDGVLTNIMDSVPKAFFKICCAHDNMGMIINQQLHLTVEPHEKWRERFERLGYKIEWEKKEQFDSTFYVVLPTEHVNAEQYHGILASAPDKTPIKIYADSGVSAIRHKNKIYILN